MAASGYEPPLAILLTLGEPKATAYREWPDYLAYGIEERDVAAAIRMVSDPDLDAADLHRPEAWAPVHAWRALAQLRAPEAVKPLLRLIVTHDEDDWVHAEVPTALGMIGAPAIGPVSSRLADPNANEMVRCSCAYALEQIGTFHHDVRLRCVQILTRQLAKFAKNSPDVNGMIVTGLLDLGAIESLPVIERAYRMDCVDQDMCDWEDVLGAFFGRPDEQGGTTRLPRANEDKPSG